MEILFGFVILFLMTAVAAGIITLIADIIMMHKTFKISWKESIICGWLYFTEGPRKN
jgi:hypothetical protein